MMATISDRDRDMLARIGSDLPPAPALLPVRPARPSDHGFIYDAWQASLSGERSWKGCDRAWWREEMARTIGRSLNHPMAVVRVACDPEDDDTIAGFMVGRSDGVLHYVYVRDGMRGHGLVPAMLEGLGVQSFSFRTEAFVRRLQPFTRGWKYRPCFTF